MEFRIDDGNEILRTFMKETKTDVPYERSWDSLMPVIDKIEYIVEHERPEPLHKRKPNYYYIRLGMMILSMEDGSYKHIRPEVGTRLEKNWKCCIEFIQWYNTNCK